MKLLRVGDKVKVIGQESNSAFKLHGKICTICEVGKDHYGLEEEIPLNIDFGGVHHYEVELVTEYNETFNPEAHSHLIIDFDKVETIEEDPCITFAENYVKKYNGVGRDVLHIVVGIKSDAARNYWFKIFQEEQKAIKQLFEELDPLKRAELIQGYCDECGQNTTCYCKNDE